MDVEPEELKYFRVNKKMTFILTQTDFKTRFFTCSKVLFSPASFNTYANDGRTKRYSAWRNCVVSFRCNVPVVSTGLERNSFELNKVSFVSVRVIELLPHGMINWSLFQPSTHFRNFLLDFSLEYISKQSVICSVLRLQVIFDGFYCAVFTYASLPSQYRVDFPCSVCFFIIVGK